MSNPVVVSRIQNRRGTQDQFDNLYPPGFDGTSGYGGIFNQTVISNSNTVGSGTVVTVQADGTKYPVGTNITLDGVTPSVYNGEFIVTSATPTQITFNGTATGAITVPGQMYPTYNSTLFPNVLLPGELALCTDSRRVFVGNLNGGFVEMSLELPINDLQLLPIVLTLPANAPSWTSVISFPATPFFSLLYDLTDNLDPNWNAIGTDYTKNGKLEITTSTTLAILSDSGTDINNSLPADISFKADLVGPNVEISYTHDFPYSLTFSSGSVHWLPF